MRRLAKNEYPVLPCGRLNLTTGTNQHFNVLTDWEPGSSFLALYRLLDGKRKATLRIVAGHGLGQGMPLTLHLAHDQTHRRIGGYDRWEQVTYVDNTAGGLQILRELLCVPAVAMCVLK